MNIVHILSTDHRSKSYKPFKNGDILFRFSYFSPDAPQQPLEGPTWVFVDWVLEDMSGLDLVRRLRADPRTARAHITLVLEKGEEADKRRALRAGADDYAIGPVDRTSILDRVLALLDSRPVPYTHQVIECGSLVIDIDAWRAMWDTREIELSPHEFRVLRFFAENANRAMPREEIIEALGRDPSRFDARNVDAWIKTLRNAFSRAGIILPIRTVRSIGYVLDD